MATLRKREKAKHRYSRSLVGKQRLAPILGQGKRDDNVKEKAKELKIEKDFWGNFEMSA